MQNQINTQNALSDWLDQTQRESWQLELVFSGFVIFLLISGLGPYHDLQEVIEIKAAANKYFDVFQFPYHLIKAAYYLLLGTIILHVFFRGLWISTIGLRSVSGGIDWDQVNIAPRFKSYLNNDIKSFDDYINSIEQYCSLFFSFAFILVFSILAITLFGLTSEFTRLGIQFLTTGSFFGDSPVSNIIMLVYALLALIYLLDFISMGFVKRQKWLAPIYYPVYRYFGFITLAKFYRPIYYNLIDHRLGRRLILAIFPICLFTFGLMSLQYYEISYIQHNPHWFSDQWYVSDSYEDSGKESMAFYKPSIQSDIIDNNHVKLFLPYIPLVHDPAIEMICPDLEPGYFKGLKMRGVASIGKIENWDSDPKELLRCMNSLWNVIIDDSLYQDVKFRYYEHPTREQYGMLTIIPIHHLNHEEHYLRVEHQRVHSDTLRWEQGRNMWFYKE